MTASPGFMEQFRTEMVGALPTRSRREKEAFASLAIHEQAWRFMNWQSRLVHPHPRQVLTADGFDSLPEVGARQTDLDGLLDSIARGWDVSAHLSVDVHQSYALHPPGRKHGPDFDLLLNEWGIHHLHLGSASGGNGFRKRSSEVLFAIFVPGTAYVLAVARHGMWTSRKLVEAAVGSWPERKLFFALNVLPGTGYTECEHLALRKAGLTTAAIVGGQHWISGITLGITTALVSGAASREASRVLQGVRHFAEYPEHVTRLLQGSAARSGRSWPIPPSIKLRRLEGPDRYCFGFVEEHSGARVIV